MKLFVSFVSGTNLQIMPSMHVSAENPTQAIPHAKKQTHTDQTHNVHMKVLAPVMIEFFK